MTAETRSQYLIGPGDAQGGTLFGGIGTVFKVDGALTGGTLAIVEHPVAAGMAAAPHTHTKEDELSYVLEGAIRVWIGTDEFTAPAGSYVYKPRNIEHAFWNPGPAPARLLEIIWPAGLEDFFRRMTELVARRDPSAESLMREVGRAHGIVMDANKRLEFEKRLGIDGLARRASDQGPRS